MGAVLVRSDSTAHLCAASHCFRGGGLWNAVRTPRSAHILVSRGPGPAGSRRRWSQAVPDHARTKPCCRRGVVRRDVRLVCRDDDWFSDADCSAGGALYVVGTGGVELSSAFWRRRRDARVSLLPRLVGLWI